MWGLSEKKCNVIYFVYEKTAKIKLKEKKIFLSFKRKFDYKKNHCYIFSETNTTE